MNRKRPTDAQLTDLLSQPHFRRTKTEQSASAAQTATPMLVDVDKIVPYDRNPRRTDNDKYDEIKASIQNAGLDRVLGITQRPDTDRLEHYMIGAGGNTCLVALKELWQETGDTRFKQVWCQFRPWENETQTLLAHVRENDLRSDLTLIDRALAIRELRQMMETEAGRSLSQRELKARLNDGGYQIGRTMIGWYGYTVDSLYPHIPTALRAGMGRHAIDRIHALQRGFLKAWESLGVGDSAEAEHVFGQTLLRSDDETLDIDALRRDLEEELSVSADCDLQRASLEIGAALNGSRASPESAPTGSPDEATASADTSPTTTQAPLRPAAESPPDTGDEDTPSPSAPAARPAAETAPATGNKAAATEPRQPHGENNALRNDTTEPSDDRPSKPTPGSDATAASAVTPPMPTDLKTLRGRSWTLASRIAQSARMGDIVVPIHGGLGYLIGPVPLDVQEAMHPDIARTAICTWWQLAALAEQFAGHGRACEWMPAAWAERRIGEAMRHAGESNQPFTLWQWRAADESLFADVPGLEPNNLGPWLYSAWTDRQWRDFSALVDTYRALYRQTENAPWERP